MSEGKYSHYSSDELNSYTEEQQIDDLEMEEVEDPTILVESQILTQHIAVIGKIPLGKHLCGINN